MATINFTVTYDDPEKDPGQYTVATVSVNVGILLARHRAKSFARRVMTKGVAFRAPQGDGTIRILPASSIRMVDVKHPLLTVKLVREILKS